MAGLLVAGGIMAGAGLYKGWREERKAKKAAEASREKAGERPTYNAPSEYGENVGLAQRAFDTNLGAGSAIERNLNSQAASGRRDLKRSGASFSDLLAGSTEFSNNLMRTQMESDVGLATNKIGLMQNLMQAQKDLASSKEDEFQYNEAGRYAEHMGRADQFENRRFAASQGTQQNLFNLGGTLLGSGMGGSGGGGADFGKFGQDIKGLFGGNRTTTTNPVMGNRSQHWGISNSGDNWGETLNW